MHFYAGQSGNSSSTFNWVGNKGDSFYMKRLSQTLKVGLALFMAIFANGLLPTAMAYAYPGTGSGTLHEVVCHAEGNGSWHAIPPAQTSNHIDPATGQPYTNGVHVLDFLIYALYPVDTAWNDLSKEVKDSIDTVCAAGPNVTASPVTFADPCGTANDTYTIPTTEYVQYKVGGNVKTAGVYPGTGSVTVTAEATLFHILVGTSSWSYTFTNATCDQTVAIPAAPAIVDPCGPANAAWTLPADTDSLDWSLVDGVLSVQTKTGYIFTDQTTLKNFGLATDSGVACPPQEVGLPNPTSTDPCGLRNATWNVQTPVAHVTWTLEEDGDLVATTGEGYVFTGGATSHNYGKAVESNQLCPVTPAEPTYLDFCGLEKDSVNTPEDTDYVSYSLSHEGTVWTVTATPSANYELVVTGTDYVLNEDGTATWTVTMTDQECKVTICHRTDSVVNPYVKITVSEEAVDGVAGNSGNEADHFGEHKGPLASSQAVAQDLKDDKIEWGDIIPPVGDHDGLNWSIIGQAMLANNCNYVEEATPTAPRPDDTCYNDNDWVFVEPTEGVSYYIGEDEVSGWQKVTGDSVTITAVADTGYYFDPETTTSWTFEFTDKKCVEITKTAKQYVDVNHNGIVDAGDVMTWKIVLTNTSDEALDDSILDDHFYVEVTDEGATLDVSTFEDLAPGESVELTATKPLSASEITACKVSNTVTFAAWRVIQQDEEPSFAEALVAQEVSEDEDTPLATGSATANATLSCPQVLGTSTPPAVLPATIPATGPVESKNLLVAMFASILAYGATFFLQQRRDLRASASNK